MGASGLIAPEDAKRLGQLVGADVLVSATMTPFGESVRLSVKALETETAVLVASARGDVPRTGAVEELLNKGLNERLEPGRESAHRPARERKIETVTAKGFVFELQSCQLSGEFAECLFVVENKNGDSILQLDPYRSRLFDDLGNEYAPSLVRIGNQRETASLIQGVPTPLALTFEGLSRQATRVALLTLSLWVDRSSFSAQFRDFPFSANPP